MHNSNNIIIMMNYYTECTNFIRVFPLTHKFPLVYAFRKKRFYILLGNYCLA